MNNFSVRHNLPKLTQKETNEMDMHTSVTEVDFVAASLPTEETPGQGGITDGFYQTFKKKCNTNST